MLDIRFIRENADAVQQNARHKNYSVDIAQLLKLDDERRELSQNADELRERRNTNAASMKGGKPSKRLLMKVRLLKLSLPTLKKSLVHLRRVY